MSCYPQKLGAERLPWCAPAGWSCVLCVLQGHHPALQGDPAAEAGAQAGAQAREGQMPEQRGWTLSPAGGAQREQAAGEEALSTGTGLTGTRGALVHSPNLILPNSSLSLLAFQRVGILTGRMALAQPPSLLVSAGQGQRRCVWGRSVLTLHTGQGLPPVLCACLGSACGDGAQSTARRDLLLHSQGTQSSVGPLGIRNTCSGVYRDQAREMNSVLPAGTPWSCGGGLGDRGYTGTCGQAAFLAQDVPHCTAVPAPPRGIPLTSNALERPAARGWCVPALGRLTTSP